MFSHRSGECEKGDISENVQSHRHETEYRSRTRLSFPWFARERRLLCCGAPVLGLRPEGAIPELPLFFYVELRDAIRVISQRRYCHPILRLGGKIDASRLLVPLSQHEEISPEIPFSGGFRRSGSPCGMARAGRLCHGSQGGPRRSCAVIRTSIRGASWTA